MRGRHWGGARHPGCDARLVRCPVPSPALTILRCSATTLNTHEFIHHPKSTCMSSRPRRARPDTVLTTTVDYEARALPSALTWFQGGLVFKTHRLVYHSTEIKQKRRSVAQCRHLVPQSELSQKDSINIFQK